MDVEELPLLGEPGPVEIANSLYQNEDETFDFFATPEQTSMWFRHASVLRGLQLPQPHSADSNAKICELRNAIHRALVARVDGTRPEPVAVRVINRNAALAPVTARLEWPSGDAPHAVLQSSGPTFDRVCGQLAMDTIEVLSGAQGDQLRRCQGPGCSMLFVQHHKRRRFCHESCSHRDRQMRYYRRKKNRDATPHLKETP